MVRWTGLAASVEGARCPQLVYFPRAGSPRGLIRRRSAGMKVFVAGLSYKTAPVEVRERLAVRPSLLPVMLPVETRQRSG